MKKVDIKKMRKVNAGMMARIFAMRDVTVSKKMACVGRMNDARIIAGTR